MADRINPNKPMRLEANPQWKVTPVGVMPNGDIVVHVESWATPAVFDPETGLGRQGWSSYRLENEPEITSGFYGWNRTGQVGRGMTAADFVWSDYPNVKFCLEVEYTDGVPTNAKFHERPKS